MLKVKKSNKRERRKKPVISIPLSWDQNTMHLANGNTTLTEDDTIAVFNSNTTHRSVFSNIGFDSGIHEFAVTIKAQPCCAYVGLAEEDRRNGTYNSFFDSSTCVGLSNFSGERNVGRSVGERVTVRLDFKTNNITYITKHGERVVSKPEMEGKTLYAALDI